VFSLIWRESFAHMADTICDTKLGCGRVEIRTGVGRRRRWTGQEKGRIVAETLNAGLPVAEVARRHDMSSQHLFNWIRAAKEGRLALPADEGAVFVPIVATATEMRQAPNAAATTTIRLISRILSCVPCRASICACWSTCCAQSRRRHEHHSWCAAIRWRAGSDRGQACRLPQLCGVHDYAESVAGNARSVR
jgi:transposase-like protein